MRLDGPGRVDRFQITVGEINRLIRNGIMLHGAGMAGPLPGASLANALHNNIAPYQGLDKPTLTRPCLLFVGEVTDKPYVTTVNTRTHAAVESPGMLFDRVLNKHHTMLAQ